MGPAAGDLIGTAGCPDRAHLFKMRAVSL